MNITHATTDTAGRLLGFQCVTTIAGLTIAALAGVLLMGGETSTLPRHALGHRAEAGGPLGSTLQAREVVYYLVNSEDQARHADFLENEATGAREAVRTPEPNRMVQVVYIETPQKELAVMEHLASTSQLLDSNTRMEVVDLRDSR